MHVQIVNFSLVAMDEKEYRALCDEIAPAFAAVDGLLSKVWLANASTSTYGGVYFWRDRAAMEAHTQSELFRTVATHPNLAEITSTDFEVMEEPTRITRGLATRA